MMILSIDRRDCSKNLAIVVTASPSKNMSEKKEIIDYLRNRQKAAEIEAKVNGINLWVLMGAIALVLWQLIEVVNPIILIQLESALRVLLCVEAAYLFFWMCSQSRVIQNDLRYLRGEGDIESPFLTLIEGVWILIPPGLFLAVAGRSFSAGFLILLGSLFVGAAVSSLHSKLSRTSDQQRRFPKPQFSQTTRSDFIGVLVFVVPNVLVIFEQIVALAGQSSWIDKDFFKCLALLAAFFLLVMVAIHRKQASNGIQWTYELETDLLVGSVTTENALRRIEHRALGPRLQDVMDRFFKGVDDKFLIFDRSMDQFREALVTVEQIPAEYLAEREARSKEASTKSQANLNELKADIAAFSEYLEKLEGRKADGRVAAVLQSLAGRNKAYRDRISVARADFDRLVGTQALLR